MGGREGEMPKEAIYAVGYTDQPETEQPFLTIEWGVNDDGVMQVLANGHRIGTSENFGNIHHLIRTLRRARAALYRHIGQPVSNEDEFPPGDEK